MNTTNEQHVQIVTILSGSLVVQNKYLPKYNSFPSTGERLFFDERRRQARLIFQSMNWLGRV